eukprot:GHVU01111667.1.p1 GENE.GHVU01111667.1~~GHVU01111667.1.p1  ORF type:complete len:434 (+),score=8.42 GHVU01111667.1:54-1355(+)
MRGLGEHNSLEFLTRLKELAQLKELTLYTSLDNQGFNKLFSIIPWLTHLEKLKLRGNRLTNYDELTRLCKLLYNHTKVRSFYIEYYVQVWLCLHIDMHVKNTDHDSLQHNDDANKVVFGLKYLRIDSDTPSSACYDECTLMINSVVSQLTEPATVQFNLQNAEPLPQCEQIDVCESLLPLFTNAREVGIHFCLPASLASLRQFHKLERLNCRYMRGNNTWVKGLCEILPHLSQLVDLELAVNSIGDSEMDLICEALAKLHNLKSLNLSYNTFGSTGIESLCKVLPHLSQLVGLNLSYNTIGDSGMDIICESLPKLHNLESLNLSENKFGDTGIESLCKVLPQFPQLSNIDVSLNAITNIGMLSLCATLQHVPQLADINLEGNRKIRNTGLEALCSVLPNTPHLKKIDLIGVHVSEEIKHRLRCLAPAGTNILI